jgi:hypothetical protein
VVGPIYPQATAVTVDDIDTSGASIVRVYAGNTQIGSAGGPFANPSIVINVPSLANGTAVSATQTVAGEESCKSVPVIVGVPAPTIGDDLLVPTQNTVTVTDVVVGQATRVDVYVSESTLIGSVTTTGFASDTVVVPVAPALGNGQSITASQTIGGVEGLLSAAVVVAVPAPSVPNVLALGDNAVLVQDLHPLASTATVYINDSPAGSAPTGGATSVSVPIGASLTPGDRVAATQTIGGVEGPESEELTVQAGYCNVVFESDMDSPAGWTAFVPAADAAATFGFDYSTMGIPPSPFGGGTTRALKFEVNKSSATRQTVAVQPTGLNMTGRFQVRFDFWINANGPFPGGGTGSTEMLGGGVGFTGVQPVATSAGPGSSGGYLVISGEGGASRDWRLYKNTGEQFIESGQYDIDTNEVVGNPPTGSQDLAAHFPAVSPPPFQQANYPQQTGQTFPGAGGFAWHTMVITVDSDNARANFTVDGLSIGTINGNIGAAVNLSGGLQLLYSDIFTSVSDNADLSFGLVDNFVVLTDLPNPGTNGDWDNDGDVNLEDFIRFADCLSGPGELADPRTGPGCRVVCEQVFDRDADGDIDLYDFARFAQLLP